MTQEIVEGEVRELVPWQPPAPAREPGNGHFEQVRMEGAGRYEGADVRVVLAETQVLKGGDAELTLTVERRGGVVAIGVDVPEVLSPNEAKLLKDMLDRAVKAAKSSAA